LVSARASRADNYGRQPLLMAQKHFGNGVKKPCERKIFLAQRIFLVIVAFC
jgi:hypothetical protein